MNKERIKKLILKYEKLSGFEKEKYNEQQTKDHFIRPLFEALGWNFEEDVWPETEVSRKRVDYAFKIDGVTKFYVEAKALAINLDEERWAEQAINYSWHKSVPWVILTDFEGIKIFNTEWDVPDIQSCKFVEISYREYLTSDKMHLLSRSSFIEEVLDKKADEIGRKPKRIIDEQLADDLVRWRETLYKDLKAYNLKTIDDKKILETVQTILNRLIFIRTLEDRHIEDIILQPLVREWEEKKGIKVNDLLRSLNKVFRKIGKDYDSGLFEKGICDFLGEKIDADDNTFVEIIDELYRTKGKKIRYNFADIPADIFGSIYEEYLDHIQKGEEVNKKTGKRKSQGIYYTPRYIVDYIVENTIGEILKNKTESEINNLKILDPACGSGSFLNRAYQKLIDYWQNRKLKRVSAKCDKLKKFSETYNKKHGNPLSSAEKMRILRNNIFGVDLDLEAVELARLNLLLRMVSERIKLPNLVNNIQEGNSLISGNEKELKKYFGSKWKEKKPFDWREKFPESFNQGGFDVIIGNPPYVQSRNLNDKERHFYWNNYLTDTNHSDVYSFFIEKAIDLLKDHGLLGFIVPTTWMQTPSFSSLRKKIFGECKVSSILYFDEKAKIFNSAQVSNVILIVQKESNKELRENNKLEVIKNASLSDVAHINSIKQAEIDAVNGLNIFIDKGSDSILKKISARSITLYSICNIIGGLRTGNDERFLKNKQTDKDDKKLLRGRNVGRYNLDWAGEYIWYRPDLMKVKQAAAPKEAKIFEAPEKLLVRMITGNAIIATYDNEGFYFLQDNLILPRDEYSIKYLLSILNSKLSIFVIKNTSSNIAITQSLLKKFPIHKINFSKDSEKRKHDELVILIDKILNLNKKLQKIDPILDDNEYNDIKKKIEKTDREINRKVYELYGLTEEEIKIVEKS